MVLESKERKISVILFDLGFTLINFEGNFHQVMRESHLALADSLINTGYPLDRSEFAQKFNEVISEYYRVRAIDMIEKPVEGNLQQTLAHFGLAQIPDHHLQAAVEAMYTFTEAWWKIEPDTHQTLSALKQMGYRLALISNASNAPNLNRLIDNHQLRGYFEAVVISADEGIRKPDPRIFANTLARLGVSADNAIMVGDTLPADILGARMSNIKSVWVTRRADRAENNELVELIKPDYSISELISLVPLMKQLNPAS